jgi:hypothetical protein
MSSQLHEESVPDAEDKTVLVNVVIHIFYTSRDGFQGPFPRPASKQASKRHAMHIYISFIEDSTPSHASMQIPVLLLYLYKISPTSPCARKLSYNPGSFLTMGFSSNHFNNVWYMTSIVPLCTLVQTPLGPTPLNQPATPSVR